MNLPLPSETSVEAATKWAAFVGAAVIALRQAVKTFKADRKDNAIIESETQHILRLENDIATKSRIIAGQAEALRELAALESEGAPDIAVLGVYVEDLTERVCPMVATGQCPAINACEHIGEIYANINDRRLKKAKILATGGV